MRLKLTLEYDGTPFHGFQRQEGLPSVQEAVENAFKKVLRQEVSLVAAGRTDKGVHALGQVCHADVENAALTPFRLKAALNASTPEAIAITEVAEVDETFHARFSAKARRYRYVMVNRREMAPLLAGRAAHIRGKRADEKKMHEAAQALLGEHNCSAFRTSECQSKTPMVFTREAGVQRDGDRLLFEIEANHFLHNMVRILAGTLAEIGQGKRPVDDIARLIKEGKRPEAGATLPPAGLYFVKVIY